MTGYGKAVGNGLATVMRGGPAMKYSAGTFNDCCGDNYGCGDSSCSVGCSSGAETVSYAAHQHPAASAPKPTSNIELKPLGAQV